MKKTTHKNIKFKLLIARKKETEEKILMVERKKCNIKTHTQNTVKEGSQEPSWEH